MAAFDVVRRSVLPPQEVWARLTDWVSHGRFIPLTAVTVAPGPTSGPGTVFVARTGVGPLHFDDPMEVTYWRPPGPDTPGLCRIVKRGRVITGWAVLEVAKSGSGSVINWREEASVRLAGPLLNGPNRLVGKRVFGRLVDGLLRG